MSVRYELVPLNKYVVIKPQAEDERVGSGILYRPASALEKQHKMGTIIAFDECDEAEKLHVGAKVVYDSIGSVEHRVGNQMFTTVKVLNVIARVDEVAVSNRDTVPGIDPNGVV